MLLPSWHAPHPCSSRPTVSLLLRQLFNAHIPHVSVAKLTCSFDRASATFPYPFQTPTQDLIVVKQSKAVYDAVSRDVLTQCLRDAHRADHKRIAPFLQQAQPVLQDVLHKTAEINSALSARAVATVQTSKEYSAQLVEQLKAIAQQGNGVPAQLIEVS